MSLRAVAFVVVVGWVAECQGALSLILKPSLPPDHFRILTVKDKEPEKGTTVLARVIDPDYHK